MKESFFLLYINHSKYMFYLIIKQIEVKVFIHNFWEAFGVTADLLKMCNRIDGVLKLIVHCSLIKKFFHIQISKLYIVIHAQENPVVIPVITKSSDFISCFQSF